ncbi:hypothetical protein JCM18750_21010 [Halostagnicola bangensis]
MASGSSVAASRDPELPDEAKPLYPMESEEGELSIMSTGESTAVSEGSMHEEFGCDEVDWASTVSAGEYSLSVNRTLTFLRSNFMNGYHGYDGDGHLYEFTLSAFGADACRTENTPTLWGSCSTAREESSLTPFENRGQRMSVEVNEGDFIGNDSLGTFFNYEDPHIYGRSYFKDDEFIDHEDWVADDLDNESFDLERESDYISGFGTAFGIGGATFSGGLASMLPAIGAGLSVGGLALSLISGGDGEAEMSDDSFTFEFDPSIGGGGSNQWFEHYMYFSIYVPAGESCQLVVEDSVDIADLVASGRGGYREEVSDETQVESYLNNYDTESWSINLLERDKDEDSPPAYIW